MDNPHPVISFDNTEYAFAYKTDQELKKANFLFSSMGYGSLVKLGTRFTPGPSGWDCPSKGLIRNTIFKQFVGGETLEETARVANRLEQFGVQVILDYGVEGKEGEENFDHACGGVYPRYQLRSYPAQYALHEHQGNRFRPFCPARKARCCCYR